MLATCNRLVEVILSTWDVHYVDFTMGEGVVVKSIEVEDISSITRSDMN
jgi:hypothetical protein